MANRQEEKRRRREERLAREQAEAAAAARTTRLRLGMAVLVGLLAFAAAVVLVTSRLGGGASGTGAQPHQAAGAAQLPRQRTADLTAAAKAAGCRLLNPRLQPATHDTKDFRAADYDSNPPTSGPHNPNWYQDGVYAPGDTPRLGMLVHPLEHGRIEVQYAPGTPKRTVARLEGLLAEQSGGYHMLLFQNATRMKYAVAATAWGHAVGCPTMNDRVFDAIRTFRERYIDKGPERVP